MEERARILKMLEDGKINAQEAAKLLDSIEKKTQPSAKTTDLSSLKGKKLKIKVESKEDDENVNVNISVPLSLAKMVSGFIPKDKAAELESSGINLDTILQHIDELENLGEDIVNIDSEKAKVRICIE